MSHTIGQSQRCATKRSIISHYFPPSMDPTTVFFDQFLSSGHFEGSIRDIDAFLYEGKFILRNRVLTKL